MGNDTKDSHSQLVDSQVQETDGPNQRVPGI